MKYFEQINLPGLDLYHKDIYEELASTNLWDVSTSRRRIPAQKEAFSIPLRIADFSYSPKDTHQFYIMETIKHPLAQNFPITNTILSIVASELKGKLGRAMFARLPPGAQVTPHSDGDKNGYYGKHNRYHFVIASIGTKLISGDEDCLMEQGTLWWFANMATHSAINNTDKNRDHLIFDLLPEGGITKHQLKGCVYDETYTKKV